METKKRMKLKRMVYSKTAKKIPQVLFEGFVNFHKVKILNLGTHPCAYIGVPKGNYFYGMDYNTLDRYISAHGGLTFSELGNGKPLDKDYFWFGWDYAHAGDYMGYSSDEKEHKWTTKDIYDHCKWATEDFCKVTKFIDEAVGK